MPEKNIKVSICCITYNQVDYIEDAIKSFLMQKTNFDFEIIIHDDASTDGTADIVKKYAEQYPDIIVPVLQTENQYSKGVKISQTFVYPIVKGKYIAFCEGDDFWTDENKLQKQFDYMEANPECSMCLHHGWAISKDKNTTYHYPALSFTPTKYNVEDAIKGLGIKTLTCSFFYRSSIKKGTIPNYVKVSPTGDYIAVVQASFEGYVYYMPEKMSAHRCEAKNSLTERWSKNPDLWRKYIDKQIRMFDVLDEETLYKYSDIIKKEKVEQEFQVLLVLRDKEAIKQEKYRKLFKKLTVKRKIKFYFPKTFELLRKIAHLFRNLNKNHNYKGSNS